MVNVTIYGIHGSYGILWRVLMLDCLLSQNCFFSQEILPFWYMKPRTMGFRCVYRRSNPLVRQPHGSCRFFAKGYFTIRPRQTWTKFIGKLLIGSHTGSRDHNKIKMTSSRSFNKTIMNQRSPMYGFIQEMLNIPNRSKKAILLGHMISDIIWITCHWIQD